MCVWCALAACRAALACFLGDGGSRGTKRGDRLLTQKRRPPGACTYGPLASLRLLLLRLSSNARPPTISRVVGAYTQRTNHSVDVNFGSRAALHVSSVNTGTNWFRPGHRRSLFSVDSPATYKRLGQILLFFFSFSLAYACDGCATLLFPCNVAIAPRRRRP